MKQNIFELIELQDGKILLLEQEGKQHALFRVMTKGSKGLRPTGEGFVSEISIKKPFEINRYLKGLSNYFEYNYAEQKFNELEKNM